MAATKNAFGEGCLYAKIVIAKEISKYKYIYFMDFRLNFSFKIQLFGKSLNASIGHSKLWYRKSKI